MYDWLVVGAGFTGATFARQALDAGKSVLVLDCRGHVAGNAYDAMWGGSRVQLYGPHIFHTSNKAVFDFLNAHNPSGWRPYYHKVKAALFGKLLPVPFNFECIDAIWPRHQAQAIQDRLLKWYAPNERISLSILGTVEPALAELIRKEWYEYYSTRQWGTWPGDSVINRVKVTIGYDDRYFNDTYQVQPTDGFTPIVQTLLAGADLDNSYPRLVGEVDFSQARRIFWTGSLDQLCNYELGELPYRRTSFEWDISKEPLGAAVVNYTADQHYTRTTDMAQVTCDWGAWDHWLCNELVDQERGYKCYPVVDGRNLYQQYVELAAKRWPQLVPGGRLGRYQYLDIHQAVAQALHLAKEHL